MPSDAFDILGLAPRFDLDPAAIRRAYLAKAGNAHPDRAGIAQQRAEGVVDGGAEAGAAILNAARATLEDHERRATALLARLGGPSKEADRSLPDGFLMQMMEVRERIDVAKDKAPFIAWGQEERRRHIQRAGELFAVALAAPAGASSLAPTLKAIRCELNAWRYIERLVEQIEGQSDEEGAGAHP